MSPNFLTPRRELWQSIFEELLSGENEVKRLNPYILFLVFKLKITNGTCPRIAYAGPGRVMLTKIINKQLPGDLVT